MAAVAEHKKLTRKEKIAQGIEKPYEGSRKAYVAAERRARKAESVSGRLSNVRMSPRKVRLVADMIRGESYERASAMLKLTNKAACKPLYKLLNNTRNTLEQKFGDSILLEDVFLDEVQVMPGPMLKRIRPAPQGRAYRIRKRTCSIVMTFGLYEDDADFEEDLLDTNDELTTVETDEA